MRTIVARTVIAALLSAAAPIPPLHAQSTVRLGQGTRLRVTLDEGSRSVIATLVDLKRDTLILGHPRMPVETTIPLPMNRIRRLEVSNGTQSLGVFGAVGGLLLGVAVTAGYNGIVSSQCFPPQPCASTKPVWLGGLIGGTIGGASFALLRSERWLEIAIPGGPAGKKPGLPRISQFW